MIILRKSIFLLIALLIVGFAVAPEVQAQNEKRMQQIEKELEQMEKNITARGGKATDQEIKRAQELTIEMLMMQGMTKAQATQMSQMMVQEMKNPTMDYGNQQIDPEMAKKLKEQEEMIKQYEKAMDPKYQEEQRKKEAAEQKRAEEERAKFPGETRGWPNAAWFKERDPAVPNLKQPAGTNASYDVNTIYLSGANANTLQDIKKQIETVTGKKMTGSGNSYRLATDGGGNKFGRSVSIELEGNLLKINFMFG